MRRNLCLLGVVCFSFLLQSCLSTVRIKRDPLDATALEEAKKSTDTEGIPFYVKRALCKQQSVWLQPIYTLTLKRTVTSKFQDEQAAKAAKAELPPPQVTSITKVLAWTDIASNVIKLRVLLSKPFSPHQTLPNQQANVN